MLKDWIIQEVSVILAAPPTISVNAQAVTDTLDVNQKSSNTHCIGAKTIG